MTNKPEDMPADLYWLAVNVSEWEPSDIQKDSTADLSLAKTVAQWYTRAEWQSAREQLGLCAPPESGPECEWSDWFHWPRYSHRPNNLKADSKVIFKAIDDPQKEIPGFVASDLEWKNIIAYRYHLDSAPKINDASPAEWDAVNTEKTVWVGVDMAKEKDETVTCARVDKPARSKYHREIAPGVWVDVYDVLVAFNVANPADAHAIKKMLMPGERGAKDGIQDRREAIASLERAIEIEEKANK